MIFLKYLHIMHLNYLFHYKTINPRRKNSTCPIFSLLIATEFNNYGTCYINVRRNINCMRSVVATTLIYNMKEKENFRNDDYFKALCFVYLKIPLLLNNLSQRICFSVFSSEFYKLYEDRNSVNKLELFLSLQQLVTGKMQGSELTLEKVDFIWTGAQPLAGGNSSGER